MKTLLAFIACIFGLSCFAAPGPPPQLIRNFWTTNANAREIIQAGSNAFVTFSTSGTDVRTYLIDVPSISTNVGAGLNVAQGTNTVLTTNANVVTVNAITDTNMVLILSGLVTNGFGNIVYSNATSFTTPAQTTNIAAYEASLVTNGFSGIGVAASSTIGITTNLTVVTPFIPNSVALPGSPGADSIIITNQINIGPNAGHLTVIDGTGFITTVAMQAPILHLTGPDPSLIYPNVLDVAGPIYNGNTPNTAVNVADFILQSGGAIGNGSGITNINGANIQLSTINSNKFDAATLALFGGSGSATNILFPHMIFVVQGSNDSLALPHRLDKPYGTIVAAATNAVYGDTIYVFPGTYDQGTNWIQAPHGGGIKALGDVMIPFSTDLHAVGCAIALGDNCVVQGLRGTNSAYTNNYAAFIGCANFQANGNFAARQYNPTNAYALDCSVVGCITDGFMVMHSNACNVTFRLPATDSPWDNITVGGLGTTTNVFVTIIDPKVSGLGPAPSPYNLNPTHGVEVGGNAKVTVTGGEITINGPVTGTSGIHTGTTAGGLVEVCGTVMSSSTTFLAENGGAIVACTNYGATLYNGGNLTNLNASQLTSGTVPDAILYASHVQASNVQFTAQSGPGGFTNAASYLAGLDEATNLVALGPNGSLNNSFSVLSNLTGGTIISTNFVGNGAGLTNLTGSGFNPSVSNSYNGTFTGNGAGLTNLPASGGTQAILASGSAAQTLGTTTRYYYPSAGTLTSTTEAFVTMTNWPFALTLTNLSVRFGNNVGSGTNVVIRIYTNAVATDLLVSVTGAGAAIAGVSGTASAVIPAGANYSIGITGNNASTFSPNVMWSVWVLK